MSESRLSHFIKEGITGLLLIFLIAMMPEGHTKFTNQMDSSSCSEREVKKQFSIKNKTQKKKKNPSLVMGSVLPSIHFSLPVSSDLGDAFCASWSE